MGMQEGQLLMTQADRDRLVTLKKAKKKLITQREAAEDLGLSTRQVKRLLYAMKKRGDKAVVHGLRGKPSNRRIEDVIEQKALKILSLPVYQGFGPTLAAEYLGQKHGIEASKETVRKWMIRGKLWRAKQEKVKQVHVWRPRRSRCGELVQWDTSEHDWLEGRGEKLYLIAMIDDATSRLFARFVRHDSTEENMKLVWSYLEKFGRPGAFYTDKASLFQTAEKHKRDEPGVEKDAVEMPPTQIGRALRELGIAWIAAHSPQAKGRVERNFGTAQDRLVKGMRVAGVKTIEEANRFLTSYLPLYNRRFAVTPKKKENLHIKPKGLDLNTILCIKTERTLNNDHTIKYNGKLYQIDGRVRAKTVTVEELIDGTMRIRHKGVQVAFHEITERPAIPGKERPFVPKGKGHRPPIDHAWRPPWFKRSRKEAGDAPEDTFSART